jgi:hypothetical protein
MARTAGLGALGRAVRPASCPGGWRRTRRP